MHSLRCAAPLALMLMLSLPAASPALAQGAKDSMFNPYAADVRRALAPAPGDPAPRALDGGSAESPACRQLRMQMERQRDAPPRPEMPAAGYAGSQRPLTGPQPGAPSSEQQNLELRYQTQCR